MISAEWQTDGTKKNIKKNLTKTFILYFWAVVIHF